jgi:NAD(P)-dependent dehydrogenase (short-subunit alcohol dehydrogenase family)
MRLTNKAVIVAGGASGMGAEISRMFAAEGAQVVVADINLKGAQDVVAEIRADGGWAKAIPVDVVDKEQVKSLVQTVVDDLGRIDVLVNAVGVAEFIAAEDVGPQQLRHVIDVNLTGVFFLCQQVGCVMMGQGYGKIVNFGSTAGVAGAPYFAHYTAAKHGVVGLTKALAVEWGKFNINVNCICPGATETPMFLAATTPEIRKERAKRIPLQRFGKTVEQARVALFLSTEDSDYVTGAVVCVDGGAAAMSPATGTDVLLSHPD